MSELKVRNEVDLRPGENASHVQLAAGPEIDRLAKILGDPTRFQTRRTVHVKPLANDLLAVEFVSEIQIPLGGEASTSSRIVSLGIFPNDEHHVDLQAFDATGRQLHILSREQRTVVLVAALLRRFYRKQGRPSSAVPIGFDQLRRSNQRVVVSHLSAIVSGSRQQVKAAAEDLRANAVGEVRNFVSGTDFQELLETLSLGTHLLAFVDARPGDPIVLRGRFSKRIAPIQAYREFAVGGSHRRPLADKKIIGRVSAYFRGLLRLVGLLPMVAGVAEHSAEHFNSLHTVVEAPDGIEIEDVYWQATTADVSGDVLPFDSAADLNQFQRGVRVAATVRSDSPVDVQHPRVLWFGLQMARGPAFIAAGILALFVCLVQRELAARELHEFQASIRTPIVASLLFIPGLLAGVLAQWRSIAVSALARGCRSLLLAIASFPVLSALMIAFQQSFGPVGHQWVSTVGVVTAGAAAPIFLLVGLARRRPICLSRGRKRHCCTSRMTCSKPLPSASARRLWYRRRDAVAGLQFLGAVAFGFALAFF